MKAFKLIDCCIQVLLAIYSLIWFFADPGNYGSMLFRRRHRWRRALHLRHRIARGLSCNGPALHKALS